jgi:heme-degrading monooxygenase HmoA
MWRGWVRTEDRDAYVGYIEDTGMAEYRRTPGNRGAHMLTRDLDGGRTEIVTLSFWDSRAAISGGVRTSPARSSTPKTTATWSTGRPP